MSYDLFFRPGKKKPTARALRSWFDGRPHYQVEDGQAFYSNDSTGVYFSFDLGEGLAFNMNYFRPHVFGLEAAPELTAFIEHFGLATEDPQMDGMGDGPFSEEGFLRGWNAGNAFAVRAIAAQQGGLSDVLTLPSARVAAIWRWNVAREERAGDEDVFVPRVSLGVRDGQIISFCVWPEAIPVVLPQVDRVILCLPPPEQPTLSTVEWSRVERVIGKARRGAEPLPHAWLVHDGEPPRATRELFESAVPDEGRPFEPVAVDQVLDAELVAKLGGS